MTITDNGWAPDPPSTPADYHPQAVVTETVTETTRTIYVARCPKCGVPCGAQSHNAAVDLALYCCADDKDEAVLVRGTTVNHGATTP